LDSGIDYFLDDTDATTPNNLDWKIIGNCICNNMYSILIEGNIMNMRTTFGMDTQDLPNSYVIVAEKEDGTLEVLTKKLNIREARNHLEIFNLQIKNEEFENIKKAFIFNLKEVA
jgi:uncharacterized protein (DUF111 family)